MIYIAIALVLISLIFTKYPPTLNYKKTITVVHQQPEPPAQTQQQLSDQELREALDNAPPDLDDLLKAVNESLFDLDFGGDSQ